MIDDRELWACAHAVLHRYGPEAPAFVAIRIGSLALVDDHEGVETWKGIASRMNDLMRGKGSLQ